MGAENLIEVCLGSDVKNAVVLSIIRLRLLNLYGILLCLDKLFTSANNIIGHQDIKFSVVRYGNVMGSRGSVIPLFLKLRDSGKIPITSRLMTRFNITLDQGVDMVRWALGNSRGGEIFVPKIPSYKIGDLASAIAPSCVQHEIGIRPGEKLHEEMITIADSTSTYDLGHYYSILPAGNVEFAYESDPTTQKRE